MLPPGPSAPTAVQTARWVLRPLALWEDCRRRYGDRFTIRLAGQPPMVHVSAPEDVKALFTAPAAVLHPGVGGRILEPIVGPRSVLVLDEDEHLRQRRLMLPAFHGERIAALSELVEEVAQREVAAWPRGEATALHPRLQALTLEIILRAVFGLEAGPRLDRLRSLLTRMLELGTGPSTLLAPLQRDLGRLTTWGRFVAVRAAVHREVDGLVADRRAAGDDDRDDVLSMFLVAEGMTDPEIRDELMTLLVAGHETTASSLAWAIEALARNPAVYERLADGEEGFADATVTETLRRRPVLPVAQPRAVASSWRLGEDDLPRGTLVTAAIHLVHHDPERYADPYAFSPERWLHAKPGTYDWIPFGGGVRRCLGASFAQLEMRAVLEALGRGPRPIARSARSEGVTRRSITLSPAHGARVALG